MVGKRAWAAGLVTAAGLGSLASAAPVTSVQFAGGPEQALQLRGPKAVAYDDADKPLFRGDRATVAKAAGEGFGRVYAWDLVRDKVRVTPAGRPGVWLGCCEVAPMSIACATSLRTSTDGALVIAAPKSGANRGAGELDAPPLGRIPDCPGDPRCP